MGDEQRYKWSEEGCMRFGLRYARNVLLFIAGLNTLYAAGVSTGETLVNPANIPAPVLQVLEKLPHLSTGEAVVGTLAAIILAAAADIWGKITYPEDKEA
jgi:hypothetical protein